REVAIALSFLVAIVAIGCYPKIAMQVYDHTTVAINSVATQAYAQVRSTETIGFKAPSLTPMAKIAEFSPD
ncbi:MAG: NAD(P)H-quinone oxidoreductase subunit 4, partial [Chroococcales cyanobacterium]